MVVNGTVVLQTNGQFNVNENSLIETVDTPTVVLGVELAADVIGFNTFTLTTPNTWFRVQGTNFVIPGLKRR
jgi:hypothetical protein